MTDSCDDWGINVEAKSSPMPATWNSAHTIKGCVHRTTTIARETTQHVLRLNYESVSTVGNKSRKVVGTGNQAIRLAHTYEVAVSKSHRNTKSWTVHSRVLLPCKQDLSK